MSDVFTKAKRSQVMAAIRSKGNKDTELKLRSLFRRNSIKGWRRHRTLPGKPDFTFSAERIAVFVDGCFWHGCRWHCRKPKSNRAFWNKKISANKSRDRLVNRLLRAKGWSVLRIWEHCLRDEEQVIERVRNVINPVRETRS